jgi:hypothetical protein
MMQIYLVILEDRLFDVEVMGYRDRDEALRAAWGLLDDYDGTEKALNAAMADDGWIFYGPYGPEGDCVRVVKRELR